MLTKTLRKLLVAIAIGSNSVTCSNPVLTVAADDPVAAAQQEQSATASLPSVTIHVEADIFDKVDSVERTDVPLNRSLHGVSIEQQCVTIRVGAGESGTSDTIEEGQMQNVHLSPSSLVYPL